MKTIKATLQILLALVCLAAALCYCIVLGFCRVVVWCWELVDQFIAAAFSTELRDFFKVRNEK